MSHREFATHLANLHRLCHISGANCSVNNCDYTTREIKYIRNLLLLLIILQHN